MNKARRKSIEKVSRSLESLSEPISTEYLEILRSDLEDILWDEEFAFENMPENLQDSERGQMSQEAQSNLEEAISLIDDFITDIQENDNAASGDNTDNSDNDNGDAEDTIDVDRYIDDIVSYLMDAVM